MIRRVVLGAVVIALAMVFAAPAFAIEVPVKATVAPGALNPIVLDVWVFDVDTGNAGVMTGHLAKGGGVGQVEGGGVDGGGCVWVLGLVDPNGNTLNKLSALAWLDPDRLDNPEAPMELLSKADAAVFIEGAYARNLITMARRDELLLRVSNAGEWGLFIKQLCLTYHDPAGDYQAWVKAVAGGSYTELPEYFQYLDVVGMDVDFQSQGVQFGSIVAGALKKVSGDFDWDPLTTLPTAQNLGNVPLNLSFSFSEMKKPGGTALDVIKCFDVEFQAVTWGDNDKEVFPVVKAGDKVDLIKPLPICNRAKMNFSVHPPNNIQNGDYAGTFKIWFAKAVPES